MTEPRWFKTIAKLCRLVNQLKSQAQKYSPTSFISQNLNSIANRLEKHFRFLSNEYSIDKRVWQYYINSVR